MATIDPQSVQETLSAVRGLVDKITVAGNEARDKLGDLNLQAVIATLPCTAAGDVDAAQWVALAEKDQAAKEARLKHVRNTLHSILGQDGPTNPKHIMHWDYAGNWWILLCAVLGFVLIVGLILGIRSQWDVATNAGWARTQAHASELVRQATSDSDEALAREISAAKAVDDLTITLALEADQAKAQDALKKAQAALAAAKASTEGARTRLARAQDAATSTAKAADTYGKMGGPTEGAILTMVVMWGALGGSLHLLRSLAAFVGNRQLVRSWVLHYFTLPFIGGALAAIVYLLLRVGLVSPSSTSGDGSAIANLNVIAIYGFAALSGLFAKAASDKLAELFGTLFRTTAPPQKDAIAEKNG